MNTVVKLDTDVEELLRNDARSRNVDFDRAVNDAIRAALERNGDRFEQKTYALGSNLNDPKKVLAELNELDDLERLRKMSPADTR